MADNPPSPPTAETQLVAPSFDNAKLYVWVKGLESKVNNLIREVNIIKTDFLKKTKDLNKELKTLNDDLLEFRHEQDKLQQKTDLIIRELKKTAGKEEIVTLQKYVDLWNPLHFATQRDIEGILEMKLSELKSITRASIRKTRRKKMVKKVKKRKTAARKKKSNLQKRNNPKKKSNKK